MGISYLFIAHGLAVVEHISHRVAVMYLGRIAEIADSRTLYENPVHPYTRALLSAIPNPDPDAVLNPDPLPGEVPTPIDLPSGCFFHNRCVYANDRCRVEKPELHSVDGGCRVACHGVQEGRVD